MIIPNGYEYWLVTNFEKGPVQSKWYRAESSKSSQSEYFAELNVIGVTKATIDKFQYLHHLNKYSEKVTWFDFAWDAVKRSRYHIFPNHSALNIKFRVVNDS